MKRIVTSILVSLTALALIVGASGTAARAQSSASSATESHYATAITPVYGSKYPIAGHLDLQMFPSGIVRGYYHNAYQKAFVQVTGGRDGNYIWFDIGPSNVDMGMGAEPDGRVHVVGTVDANGAIHGQIYANQVSGNSMTLPLQNSSATGRDQYLFVATPEVKG